MSGSKKRRAPLIIFILLFILIEIPLIAVGISFIGRITPDSVIPDSFDLFASIPDLPRFAARVLEHENLNDILALAELSPLVSNLHQLRETGLAENKFLRFAAKGRLDAAFFQDERILAAWDAGILSPLIKFLPLLAGRFSIPGLYYVNAGRNSRFEYRLENGSAFYIGPHKNLLVISNNSPLYESVISGSSGEGGIFGSSARKFHNRDYDIAFLLSPGALANILGNSDPQLKSAINLLQFPGPVEAALSILPKELKLHLLTPLESGHRTEGSQALQTLIERKSQGAPLAAMVPDNTQYMTLLSAGSLKELLGAVSAISANAPSGPDWENTLRRADSGARMAAGINLEELLYSWLGTQFAVYGLEGRPSPVIAVEIKDEKKRKEVFDRAFRSIFLNENINLTLDGSRIPQIEIPIFLASLLTLMNINIPSPYYIVYNNYLFISESAETLLEAINAVRRNEVLPKQELWRALSEDNSGPSSFTLYYSLERSLPSFIEFKNKTYAAVYPKSFFGEIFLLDASGITLTPWPVPISGIAFGSPEFFIAQYPDRTSRLFTAFITQAGELSIYTENAEVLPGFPIELEGVFYLQPVFDGEYLWVIEFGGTLYRIGLDGEVFSRKIPRLTVKDDGYITVSVAGKDKKTGVFFSGDGNALYGYFRNFSSIDGFPLPVWGKPVFGDLNADGKIEVAGIGMDNKLYMWQFR